MASLANRWLPPEPLSFPLLPLPAAGSLAFPALAVGVREMIRVILLTRPGELLLHPELGAIELDCQALFTEDQSQCLLVLTAAPRTEAAEKLALLSVLGTQTFAPAAPGGEAR